MNGLQVQTISTITIKPYGKGNALFPSQRQPIHYKHLRRQHEPGNLAIIQRHGKEAHRAAPIHRRARDIEREPCDGRVHQDPKVVTQVRAREAKRPHARQHQDVADGEQHIGQVRLVHGRVVWLVRERLVVETVAQNAQAEDRDAKGVAAGVGAAKDFGEQASVVFCKSLFSDQAPLSGPMSAATEVYTCSSSDTAVN